MFLFFLRLLQYSPTVLFKRFPLVVQQIHNAGALSLVIIMICGFFVGMVLSLQAINALEQFGASDQVSLLVGKSLFRELGPVLTALLFGAVIAWTTSRLLAGLLLSIPPGDPLTFAGVALLFLADPLRTITGAALLNVGFLLQSCAQPFAP